MRHPSDTPSAPSWSRRWLARLGESGQRRIVAAGTVVGVPLGVTLLLWLLLAAYVRSVEAPSLPLWTTLWLVALAAVYLYRIQSSGVLADATEPLSLGVRRLPRLALVVALTLGVGVGTHLLVGLRTYSLWWANLFTGGLSLAVLWLGLGLVLPSGKGPRVLRGRRILTLEEARAQAGSRPGLPWGGIAVPPQDATTHFLVVGSPGSGKTVTIRALMKSVLPELGREACLGALAYDPKRDVVSALAGLGLTVEGGQVLLLNPFDRRSAAWDLAADITDAAAALEAATILSPLEEHAANPYFSQAARDLVTQIIETFIELAPGRWTLRDVVLAGSSDQNLRRVLGQTPAGEELLEAHSRVPNTWDNVRGELSTKLRPYRPVAALWQRATAKISLESWFAGGTILVLGSSERSGEALRAVNRVLFKRLAQIAIDQQEDQVSRRWFFIDEAKDAGHLEGLEALLTKGRSKGMCVVLGFQDLDGMQQVYGPHQAMSLIGQCEQRAVLRVGSTHTAEWAVALLGPQDISEPLVTRPRGSLLGWGGSTSDHREKRDAVLTSQIMELEAPDRVYGPGGFYLTRRIGAFRSRLRWGELGVLAPDPDVSNYEQRSQADQRLDAWTAEDLERLGLRELAAQQSAPEEPETPVATEPAAEGPPSRLPPPAVAVVAAPDPDPDPSAAPPPVVLPPPPAPRPARRTPALPSAEDTRPAPGTARSGSAKKRRPSAKKGALDDISRDTLK